MFLQILKNSNVITETTSDISYKYNNSWTFRRRYLLHIGPRYLREESLLLIFNTDILFIVLL